MVFTNDGGNFYKILDYWRTVMTTNRKKENFMLEAALNYVQQGWAVLPLHTVVNDI